MRIVKYQENGLSLDCRLEEGQAWLTYEQVAELFGIDRTTVVRHANDIVMDKELTVRTCASFAQVRTEGIRSVNRSVSYLNHDMVMAIGFRVRSERGSEFRRWAISVLKGEAAPLNQLATEPKTPSLLAQARLMVAVLEQQEAERQRLDAVQASVQRLERIEEGRKALESEAMQALYSRPSPSADPKPRQLQDLISEYVRKFSLVTDTPFAQAWDKLYREYKYRYKQDFKAVWRNRGKKGTILTVAASFGEGVLQQLYDLAHTVLPIPED